MFIRSLTLSNILSFREPGPLTLQPLNIFIGANASGKSNLIDCIGLLRALPGNASNFINDRGGAGNWIWKRARSTADATAIASEIKLESQALFYGLTFAAVERTFAIQTEWLSNADESLMRRAPGYLNIPTAGSPGLPANISPTESILSAYRNPADPTPITELARAFGGIQIYRNLHTGTRDDSRIGVASSGPKRPLEEDGSNLALTLQELDFEGALQEVKRYLKRLSDRFEDIKVRAEGGRSQLYLQERGVGMMSATRLSDGTLKFLCLMAILCDPKPGPLICIEEPETGLHPDALAIVGDALREASARTQLIVTTHSDALVDRFTDEPENVVVCERDFDEGLRSGAFRRKSSKNDWMNTRSESFGDEGRSAVPSSNGDSHLLRGQGRAPRRIRILLRRT
jgi:predicted ATPase